MYFWLISEGDIILYYLVYNVIPNNQVNIMLFFYALNRNPHK